MQSSYQAAFGNSAKGNSNPAQGGGSGSSFGNFGSAYPTMSIDWGDSGATGANQPKKAAEPSFGYGGP